MRNLLHQLTALNPDRRLFGVRCQQAHTALLVYEQMLRLHVRSLNWIVEVGTGHGAMSLYWALWAKLRAIPFLTIDIAWLTTPKVSRALDSLGAQRLTLDCFSLPALDALQAKTDGRSGLLFLDGGDKPRELRTLAPRVPTDSLILVHDFGVEVLDRDIDDVPCVERLQPYHNQAQQIVSRVAVLRRKETL